MLVAIGVVISVLSTACIDPRKDIVEPFFVGERTTITAKVVTSTLPITTTILHMEQKCNDSSCCLEIYGYCYTHCGKKSEPECSNKESQRSGCIGAREGKNCYHNLSGNCYFNCEKHGLIEAVDDADKNGSLNCCIPETWVCETMRGDKRDNCYYEFALKKDDFNLCNEIRSDVIRTICLAVKRKDEKVCELLWESLQRDKCFRGIAIAKEKEKICEKITLRSLRDSCYYELARRKDDDSLCYKIKDCTLRDLCSRCSLKFDSSDREGIVDSYRDMVWLAAIAENCRNLYLDSYGDPEYLSYHSKSGWKITGNRKRVWVKYRCWEEGERILLKIKVGNTELEEYVSCSKKPKCSLTLLPSDNEGTVRTDDDVAEIRAKAENCKGSVFNCHADSNDAEFLNKSHKKIPDDDEDIWVGYRCRYVNPDISVELEVGDKKVTGHLVCKSKKK